MIIQTETAKKLFDLMTAFCEKVAMEAHKYIATHDKIKGYCQYPILTPFLPSDDPKYEKLYQEVPYLAHGIPRYELRDFPEERTQYGAIFNGYSSDKINILNIDGFSDLYQFITNEPEVRKALFEDEKIDNAKYKIRNLVSEIVEQYLYDIEATGAVPEEIQEKLRSFVGRKLLRFLDDTLKIDICVPICLATFESDGIKLSDEIEIVRIPDDIQKSRKQSCSYEMNTEDWVASCATHMIVLHGYCFDNKEYISINTVTRNYNAYPLHVIDSIMAVIRVVTGYEIGYEQILSIPLGWNDSTFADLKPLYGAKSHFVNANEIKKFWMCLPVNVINLEQIEAIQKLYMTVSSNEGNTSRSNLTFALKRLNRCMLRNEKDDMAIDATIGLESLLSGGTKGEITYTISNRIPVVFAHECSDTYSSTDCRKIMKKIYNYRSIVVHGGSLKDKDRYYEISGQKMEIEKIAVDFLRQTLLFILRNPEYLDAKKFDEYIDCALSKKGK